MKLKIGLFLLLGIALGTPPARVSAQGFSEEAIPPPRGRLTAPSPSAANPSDTGEAPIVVEDAGGRLVTLALKNVDIVDVIKILSQRGGFNVIINPNVKGRVTMFLENVDVNDAFLIVLEATEHAYVVQNGIYSVMPSKQYEANTGNPFYDDRQFVAVPITHASANDIASSLAKLKPKATIIVDERTNSILLRDTDDSIAIMRAAIRELDRETITENYQLNHLRHKTVDDLMKMALGKRGSYFINPRVNQVVLKDYPENVATMIALLKAHDVPTPLETRAFELDYAKFDALEAKIKLVLTPEIGQIIADERTNKLLVSDVASNFDVIQRLIDEYDTKDRQVLIEAKIVQVLLDDRFQFGINWQTIIDQINNSDMGVKLITAFDVEAASVIAETGFAQGIGMLSKSPDLFTPDTETTSSSFSESVATSNNVTTRTSASETSRNFATTNERTANTVPPFNQRVSFPLQGGTRIIATGSINGRQFEGVLNALKVVGKTKVLSSPRIITLNNEEAKIQVASKEAYVTATTLTPGTGPSTTSESVTFLDVGITLAVTPKINKNNFITMKVKPSVSAVTGEVVTSSGNTIPIISTQEIESTIQILNGTTVVLGGLHEQLQDKAQNRIPFLGALPLVGVLFKKISNRVRNSELIMFLTPWIITGEQSFFDDMNQRAVVSQDVDHYMKELKAYPAARGQALSGLDEMEV